MKKLLFVVIILIIGLNAQNITSKLGGNTSSETYDITDSNDNVLLQIHGDGDVLIGTSAASAKLSVESSDSDAIYGNQTTSTGSNHGVHGNTKSATGAGVKGSAGPTGANFGGHFSSSAMDGTGVYGEAHKYGGHFKSTAFPTGVGVYAEGTSAAGLFNGKVGIGTTTPGADLDVHGTVKVFGDWDGTLTFGTVYTAASDGFVVAYANIGGNAKLEGTTDSSAPPITVRTISERSDPGHINLMMPVKKGDMWKVDKTGVSASGDLFWIPLGQ